MLSVISADAVSKRLALVQGSIVKFGLRSSYEAKSALITLTSPLL